MDLRWYCGQAKLGKVFEARDHLVRQGFETVVPLTVRRTISGLTFPPLLGNYFLVRFHPLSAAWRLISSTRGVSKLLAQPLRDAEVEMLRDLRCDDLGAAPAVGSGLTRGAPVRCTLGPYRGGSGIVLDVVGRTVRCLLFVPAGPADVDLPLGWCERA